MLPVHPQLLLRYFSCLPYTVIYETTFAPSQLEVDSSKRSGDVAYTVFYCRMENVSCGPSFHGPSFHASHYSLIRLDLSIVLLRTNKHAELLLPVDEFTLSVNHQMSNNATCAPLFLPLHVEEGLRYFHRCLGKKPFPC